MLSQRGVLARVRVLVMVGVLVVVAVLAAPAASASTAAGARNGVGVTNPEAALTVVSLARATDTWAYEYGIGGLRSSKQQSSAGQAATESVWSDGSMPLLLSQHTGTSTSYLVYGPGDQPIYQVRADGSVLYLHGDHQGSTRLVTNSLGNTYGTITYDAYGRYASDTTPWFLERPMVGYTGQQHDAETGFVYLRARYYDPATRQFVSRDPLHTATRSPYSYANANPVALADPSGLCPMCVAVGVGFVSGAGQDLALQMVGNLLKGCGAFDDIDWNSVVASGAINAIVVIPGAASARKALTVGDDVVEAGTKAADRVAVSIESGTYVVTTPAGEYVGQSGSISARLGQHVSSGKFTQAEVDAAQRFAVAGTKLDREIAEQLLIDSKGGIDNLLNKVNPIGPRRFDVMPNQPYMR